MDNLISLLSLIPDVVMIASIICAVTPTPKDDAILAKVYKILELLAINIVSLLPSSMKLASLLQQR